MHLARLDAAMRLQAPLRQRGKVAAIRWRARAHVASRRAEVGVERLIAVRQPCSSRHQFGEQVGPLVPDIRRLASGSSSRPTIRGTTRVGIRVTMVSDSDRLARVVVARRPANVAFVAK